MRDINAQKVQSVAKSIYKGLNLNSVSKVAAGVLNEIKPVKVINTKINTVIKKATPLLKASGLDNAFNLKNEIGSYGSKVVFEVSSYSVRSFKNLKTSAGAKYANIELLEGKPRKQFIAATNQSVSLDITLRADQNWISPRDMRDLLVNMCESGEANYLIIGGKPISNNPFILTAVSDEWGVIFNDGSLFSINLSLSLEEYDPKSHI